MSQHKHTIPQVPLYRAALKKLHADGTSYSDIEYAGGGRFKKKDIENFVGGLNGNKRMTPAVRGICLTVDEAFGGVGHLVEKKVTSNDSIFDFFRETSSGNRQLTSWCGLYYGLRLNGYLGWVTAILEIRQTGSEVHFRLYDSGMGHSDYCTFRRIFGSVCSLSKSLLMLGNLHGFDSVIVGQAMAEMTLSSCTIRGHFHEFNGSDMGYCENGAVFFWRALTEREDKTGETFELPDGEDITSTGRIDKQLQHFLVGPQNYYSDMQDLKTAIKTIDNFFGVSVPREAVEFLDHGKQDSGPAIEVFEVDDF